MKDLVYSAGHVIVVTTGEYSDYRIDTVLVVVKDFCAEALLSVWAEDHGKLSHGELLKKAGHPNFQEWLVDSGYVRVVDHMELNVGDNSFVSVVDLRDGAELHNNRE